jgi:hypothetical protein
MEAKPWFSGLSLPGALLPPNFSVGTLTATSRQIGCSCHRSPAICFAQRSIRPPAIVALRELKAYASLIKGGLICRRILAGDPSGHGRGGQTLVGGPVAQHGPLLLRRAHPNLNGRSLDIGRYGSQSLRIWHKTRRP